MPDNNETRSMDIEQARAKLVEAEANKEARKDPRAGERIAVATRAPLPPTTDKPIRPVKAKPKKKSFGQKLKEAMFSEDIGNGSVSEYVFLKILVPNVKRLLSDMANTAINMALGLDPKTRTIGGNTHVSNASVYRDRNFNRPMDGPGYNRRDAISDYEWDEDTAKDILQQIMDLIDHYGECSLMDAYSICGFDSKIRTTDRDWGWTSTRHMDVYPVDPLKTRGIVDLPSARPLNR